jgi:hypothetical protein
LPRRTPNRRFTLTYVSKRIARLPVFALINAYTTFTLLARSAFYVNAYTINAFFTTVALINAFTTLALLARSAYYVIADTIFALLARSAYYGLALIFNAFFTTGA